jgi:flavorubredoxin
VFDNQYIVLEEKTTLFDSGGKTLFESIDTVFEA